MDTTRFSRMREAASKHGTWVHGVWNGTRAVGRGRIDRHAASGERKPAGPNTQESNGEPMNAVDDSGDGCPPHAGTKNISGDEPWTLRAWRAHVESREGRAPMSGDHIWWTRYWRGAPIGCRIDWRWRGGLGELLTFGLTRDNPGDELARRR